MQKSDKALAAQIRGFRLSQEMTIREVAETLGITNGTYYAILNGKPVSELTIAKVKNRLAERQAA